MPDNTTEESSSSSQQDDSSSYLKAGSDLDDISAASSTYDDNASFDSYPTENGADGDLAGLTLFGLFHTIDAHLDQVSYKVRQKSKEIKRKVQSESLDLLQKRTRSFRKLIEEQSVDDAQDKIEREIRRHVANFVDRWNDAKAVSMREKISFFCSIMTILATSLMINSRPRWIPYAYSIQLLFFMPIRFISYKKLLYHYFLYDMCYFINLLTFVFLWVFPSSPFLFEAAYALTLGPVASAILTWRNSLVFHSVDKFTSLFIHIYPPLTLTVLRHFYPEAEHHYPALSQLPYLKGYQTLLVASAMYLCWQLCYYRFVIVARREKIEKGGRITSFTYMLQNKKSFIGKTLEKIPPQHREWSFMLAQFLYTVITMLPPIFILYNSKFWSSAYLILCFAVSAWNGATFQIEIFGKRFEKELNALCKELELQKSKDNDGNAASSSSSPAAAQALDSLSFTVNKSKSRAPTDTKDSDRSPSKKISNLDLNEDTSIKSE